MSTQLVQWIWRTRITTALKPLLGLIPLLAACSTHLTTSAPFERPLGSKVTMTALDTVWFFVDGQRIIRPDVGYVDPTLISTITHLVGPAARAKYGPEAKAIIEIVTKRNM